MRGPLRRCLSESSFVEGSEMMETVVTSDVAAHRTNPSYKCLLIPMLQFPEFHIVIDWQNKRIVKCDLMPKEDFALELNELLLDVSPTYAPKLMKQAFGVNLSPVQKKSLDSLMGGV